MILPSASTFSHPTSMRSPHCKLKVRHKQNSRRRVHYVPLTRLCHRIVSDLVLPVSDVQPLPLLSMCRAFVDEAERVLAALAKDDDDDDDDATAPLTASPSVTAVVPVRKPVRRNRANMESERRRELKRPKLTPTHAAPPASAMPQTRATLPPRIPIPSPIKIRINRPQTTTTEDG